LPVEDQNVVREIPPRQLAQACREMVAEREIVVGFGLEDVTDGLELSARAAGKR
jgi:hypothetical protein